MNMVVFRRCQSALGVAAVMALALVASLVFAAMPAAAVTLSRADAGTFLRYEHGGEQVIGVMAKDSTNNYYCIEADERVEYQLGESVKLRDDDTARRLGWLMDHYRDGTAAEHAAIAVLAHDLLDLKPDTWKSRRVSVMRDNPTLRRKVEQMWEEAGSNAPANATVTRTYAEGTRTGRVTVSVTNAQGKTIAGIRYAATLNGPAVFANGSATVTGISGAEPIVYSWKATGEGEVKASVAYDRKQVDVFAVAGGQDLVRYGGSSQVSGKAVNFSVRKEFVPTLGTAVAAKVVDAGQPVVDTVTSGVDDGDSWASGLELRASGWYFDGLGVGDLSEPVMPGADETAKEFIARLGTMGFRPSAYGEASFTAPGQRVDVRATAPPVNEAAQALYSTVETHLQLTGGMLGVKPIGHDRYGRPRTLMQWADITSLLLHHMHDLARLDTAGDLYADLIRLSEKVETATTRADERRLVGVCPDCLNTLGDDGEPVRTPIYAAHSARYAVCPECGAWLDLKRVRLEYLRRAGLMHITRTQSDAARWVRENTGVAVSGNDLKNWRTRGKMPRTRHIDGPYWAWNILELLACAQAKDARDAGDA